MSRTPDPKPMACLTIGYQMLLLPADKAMAVVAALQKAVGVELSYESLRERYQVQEQPLRVSMSFVDSRSIDMPHGQPAPSPAAKKRALAPRLPL